MKEKDIYQLLNELNIIKNEAEVMEISEFDKAKVKKEIKRHYVKRGKDMVGK